MLQKIYWIDTGFACAGVIVDDDIIVETAPIFRRFLKQPIINLLSWKAVKYWEVLDTDRPNLSRPELNSKSVPSDA